MTISTHLAISNSMSSFVPKYWLNWQILVAIFNEFRRQIKDGTTKVYIPVHPCHTKLRICHALGRNLLTLIMSSAARTNIVFRLIRTQKKILSNYNFVPKHMHELVYIKLILILVLSKQAEATAI